jgi:hypothetical protein
MLGAWLAAGAGCATPSEEAPSPAGAPDVVNELGFTASELAARLPACTAEAGNGALDLDQGCVAGLCVGSPVAEAVAGAACEDLTFAQSVSCRPHQEGGAHRIGLSFHDLRGRRPHASDAIDAVYMAKSATASTTDGLGIGVSLACFLDRYGAPEAVEVRRVRDRYEVTELRFASPRVWVQGEGGLVRRISVLKPRSGAPEPSVAEETPG